MDKETIQKNIDDAVRVFKETLEQTYLKDNVPLYGIGVHGYTNLLIGSVSLQRKTNGNYRVSGEISKDMLSPLCEGLPRELKDWDIFPLVITLFNKDIKQPEKK